MPVAQEIQEAENGDYRNDKRECVGPDARGRPGEEINDGLIAKNQRGENQHAAADEQDLAGEKKLALIFVANGAGDGHGDADGREIAEPFLAVQIHFWSSSLKTLSVKGAAPVYARRQRMESRLRIVRKIESKIRLR